MSIVFSTGDFPAPTKPCPPYPATIDLSMNNSRDFTTTNNEQYKGQWDVNTVKVKAQKERYSPPKEKFHTTTQTMADFQPKDISVVRLTKPAQSVPKSKIKLSDETSYKKEFPRYKTTGFIKKYGDFHEQKFYLKPIQKFQGDSVTTKDFIQHEVIRPRTNFKPKIEVKKSQGEIANESVYRSTYKQKEPHECAYIKYLKDRKKPLSAS